jgi:DNA-binding transcriptional MerR regulator
MKTYSIREASEATGLSAKAIRSRCDREQLRTVKRGNLRLIPETELQRNGLLSGAVEAAQGQGSEVAPPGQPLIAELLDRLERQAGELATLRALTSEAESLRETGVERSRELEAQVEDLSQRLSALEETDAPKRRWWHRQRDEVSA